VVDAAVVAAVDVVVGVDVVVVGAAAAAAAAAAVAAAADDGAVRRDGVADAAGDWMPLDNPWANASSRLVGRRV